MPSRQPVPLHQGIQPGDISATHGGGLIGRLIQRGTRSAYAHCEIIRAVDYESGTCLVDAAMGDWPWKPGLTSRVRKISDIASVVRVWRTEEERQDVVRMSAELTSERIPYDWKGICLIALANVLPWSWLPDVPQNGKVICSEHVALCVEAARPEDYDANVPLPATFVWPGGLLDGLFTMVWNDSYGD